jgi:2-polyprenyl-3-methyl-5-hydroxy-6-metoxy-1,4-benzoquinol methylase
MDERMGDLVAQQDVYDYNERPEVEPFIPRTATTALDVGCGRGGFGTTLRAALGPDARIVGVEPVASQAEHARSRGFDEVVCDYFPPRESALGSFDLVCFNDVLEHLVDPWQVLEETRSWLTPGGHVLAAIPNIQYWPAVINLFNGHWEYTESGLMDRTHLRFFTRESVLGMFDRAGYDVVSCQGANSVWGMEWKPSGGRVRNRVRSILRGRLARVRPDGQFLHFVVLATPRLSGTAA